MIRQWKAFNAKQLQVYREQWSCSLLHESKNMIVGNNCGSHITEEIQNYKKVNIGILV